MPFTFTELSPPDIKTYKNVYKCSSSITGFRTVHHQCHSDV